MPLNDEERAVVIAWSGFLRAARQHAARLEAAGFVVPAIGEAASLQSLVDWLAALHHFDDDTRRALHGLINNVFGIQRARVLAGRHGCPPISATLDEWDRTIAQLASELPRTPDASADHAATREADGQQQRRPARILCVEDEESWQQELTRVVRRAVPWLPAQGLLVAGDAVTAHRVLDECRGDDGLIILDLGIPEEAGAAPDRRHGLRLLEDIRTRASHWPVIVWSVPFDSIEDHRVALSHGISDYLLKTGSSSELATAIRRAVAQEPYRIAFAIRGSQIAIGDLLCALTPQQHELLWEMAVDGGWKTAVEWEDRLTLTPNAFHGILNDLHAKLADELRKQQAYFDWPRLIASRPRDGDAVDDTREYRLLATWSHDAPQPHVDARRAFRVLGSSADMPHTRLRSLSVLVVDDEAQWHERVATLLRAASYDVKNVSFHEDWPGIRPDVVCLDLMDLADPAGAEPAGFRWLRTHAHTLGGVRVLILSSASHRDELRVRLTREFGVRPLDVVLKDEDDKGEGPKEWRSRLLRCLYQVERDRIVGAGLAALANDEWPPTLQRADEGWDLVTGERRAPVFRGARNRRKLVDRLATRPFLPVPWKILNDAVYADLATDAEPAADPKSRLATLVTNCRRELQSLVRTDAVHPIDTSTIIQYADGGYVLNARVVKSPR